MDLYRDNTIRQVYRGHLSVRETERRADADHRPYKHVCPPTNPSRAIALAVSATVLFGSSDTISKYLSGSLPIVEFIWIRYILFLITAGLPRPPSVDSVLATLACRS